MLVSFPVRTHHTPTAELMNGNGLKIRFLWSVRIKALQEFRLNLLLTTAAKDMNIKLFDAMHHEGVHLWKQAKQKDQRECQQKT